MAGLLLIGSLSFALGVKVGSESQAQTIATNCETVSGFYRSLPSNQVKAFTCTPKGK